MRHNSLRMSEVFTFEMARKVIFGNGSIQKIGEEASNLFSGRKILMVTDKGVLETGLCDQAVDSLRKYDFNLVLFDGVVPNAPLSVIRKCVDFARREKVELVFGIGGGSSLDIAKAVAVMLPHEGDIRECLGIDRVKQQGLPKILVPTTAGTGSEINNAFVLGDDENGEKIACFSRYAFSDLSIIDPLLTLAMPPVLTAETGMDALSHALESFVNVKANPLSETLSLRALELISENLRKAYAKGTHDLEARYSMCLGVCLGSMAIRSSGLAIIHASSDPIVMNYHVSHGVAISIMMPYAIQFNLVGNMEKYAAIAAAMGNIVEGLSTSQAAHASIDAIKCLIKDLNLPSKLRDIGAKKDDFPKFAKTVVKRSPLLLELNPRNVTEQDLLSIYESAW